MFYLSISKKIRFSSENVKFNIIKKSSTIEKTRFIFKQKYHILKLLINGKYVNAPIDILKTSKDIYIKILP